MISRARTGSRRLLLVAAGAALLGGQQVSAERAPDPQGAHPEAWTACQASDQAWVRRAILALTGRKPWGQAEVNAYEDVARGLVPAGAVVPPPREHVRVGRGLSPGRRLVAEALMASDDFRLRWSDLFMDALHVVRIEDKSQKTCYGDPIPAPFDDGSLAAWVRDHQATDAMPPVPGFKMHELLSSALEQDDLSVLYRAHLFAMMSRPIYGANLDAVGRERSRRQDFGGVFDATYIHRDLVCLSCHNSEKSKTFDADPQKNRAWPVSGLFEDALFGASTGKHPSAEELSKGTDFLRGHSMLRYDGVTNAPGSVPPFGWDGKSCGAYAHPTSDPLLHVDTYFGSIRGENATVWDLEASLHRGVDRLAEHGLTVEKKGTIADPDEAFAYLVAENIVDQVWSEVMGSGLTIANYFPRTSIQRDTLKELTDDFVASHFSLRTLLLDVVGHPAFNLLPPSAGCGESPYAFPNLWNPWTTSSEDPKKRPNGVGDGVFAISSRPLVRSLHRAMEWPTLPEYPAPATFQQSLGFFLKDADPGFRGLDFQGRLAWEGAYASCAKQGSRDFISRVVEAAAGVHGATVGDAVIAVKDRLLGEPWIDPKGETAALEAVVGARLLSRDLTGLEGRLRRACGVFVSTPEFMLGGTTPPDTREAPKLTPVEHSYEASLTSIASLLSSRRIGK
jgi:hypothetical protein